MVPVMNDSWVSLERSSSDFCFVSGMSSVDRTPVNMIKESTSKLCDILEGTHRTAAANHLHDLHIFGVVQQRLAKRELCGDCSELAACCGNAMCGGAVTGGEGFSGDNERGRVWAKILKEVGEAVQEDKGVLARARGIEGNVGEGYGAE